MLPIPLVPVEAELGRHNVWIGIGNVYDYSNYIAANYGHYYRCKL
jgi:hypothetical protein